MLNDVNNPQELEESTRVSAVLPRVILEIARWVGDLSPAVPW